MAETRWLSEDEQVTWRLLLHANALLLERLDAELQEGHGLSLPDYEVLAHLSAAPERRLRMRELADRATLSKSRLTHAVDRLERRRFVCRERCEADRRGLFAVLTPTGMDALRAAAPDHVAGVRRHLFDCVSPRDRAALARVFACVLQELRGEAAGDS